MKFSCKTCYCATNFKKGNKSSGVTLSVHKNIHIFHWKWYIRCLSRIFSWYIHWIFQNLFRIRGALKKVSSSDILLPDLRGKKEPQNKVKPTTDKFIREHILSFPRMESHYARKKAARKIRDKDKEDAKSNENVLAIQSDFQTVDHSSTSESWLCTT